MRAPGPRTAKDIWLAVAKLAVSAALLFILFREIDVDRVGAILVRISAAAFVAAVFLFALQTCVQGLRWWMVVVAVSGHIRLALIARLTFVGVFFNQVLPTSVGGDAVRVWQVHRAGVRVRSAIKSVLLERIWGVLALSLLVSVGLLYLGGRVDNAPLRLGLIGTLPLGLLGVAVLASLDRMPSSFRKWRVAGVLFRLAADIRRLFFSPARALPLLIMSIFGHFLSAMVVYVLAVALHLDLPVWDCLAIVPSVLLATLIPISFAGWGLREGAMIVLLGYLGTPADTALAVSLLYGLTTIVAALPGCLFWLQWREAPAAAAHAGPAQSSPGSDEI